MLYFHYPKNLIVNEQTIFSNMRFIDSEIILTGAVYLNSPIEFGDIRFFVNNIETKFEIIEKRRYEPSIVCKVSNEEWKKLQTLTLRIFYEKQLYTIILDKEEFKSSNLTAMTLFKNDYELLNLYIEYYTKLGINTFFLYYNDILDQEKFKFLEHINVEIHITEWNYKYWIHPTMLGHHAQVMALTDGLNTIKHFSNWCLFNDLDEYVFIENTDFNDLIDKNPEVNHFDFLAYWSKIGNDIIYYREAYNEFKKKEIIKSKNHCGNSHHKSLVKVNDVLIMGVHFPIFKNISKTITLSGMYHFCNFWEQQRSHYCQP
jgi:hypothetical protein